MPDTRLAVTTLLLMTIVAGAQQRTAPLPVARITGSVLDGLTNKPISGVAISLLQGTERRNATTNALGQFSLAATHGTARLLATKPGYAAIRPDGHQLPADGILISLTPGQQLRGLTLHIWPTGTFSGTVYDSKSKPVEYARAQLMRYVYDEDGQRALQPSSSGHGGETNDHGEFRITEVDPGDYYLEVVPSIFAERVPGEPFVTSPPAPVTVQGGSDNHLGDITLPSVRGATVHLHLINQTGQAIQNTMMKYLHWNRRNDLGTSTLIPLLILGGPERADIPLPIGPFSITAGWLTGQSPNAPALGLGNVIVDAGGTNADVNITVKKGVRITGQVVTEQPKGAARPLAGVHCDLLTDAFPTVPVTSMQDGSIAIDNIQAAIYRVQCPVTLADSYLRAITQGDRDVLKQGLQVVDSVETSSFTVSFNPAGGTIKGRVTTAQGKAGGALVVLVPDEPAAKHLYRKTNADQNGAFTIQAVAPGNYHIFAWTELNGAAYKNAAFMKPYGDKGIAVQIGPAEEKTGIETKLLSLH